MPTAKWDLLGGVTGRGTPGVRGTRLRSDPVREPAGFFACARVDDTVVEAVGRRGESEENPHARSSHDGGGAVSVERVVGLLVAAALVGFLVLTVKFPDRF